MQQSVENIDFEELIEKSREGHYINLRLARKYVHNFRISWFLVEKDLIEVLKDLSFTPCWFPEVERCMNDLVLPRLRTYSDNFYISHLARMEIRSILDNLKSILCDLKRKRELDQCDLRFIYGDDQIVSNPFTVFIKPTKRVEYLQYKINFLEP